VAPETIQGLLERFGGVRPRAPANSPEAAEPILDQRAIGDLRLLDEPGSPSLMQSLIRDYLAQAPGAIARIKTAARAGDAPAVASSAHRFAGTSLTFGARGVAEVCRRLELMAKSGDLGGAPGLFDSLEARYGEASAELRRLIES
jgi:HPt (histidine-containing phosphotransfer) domain-containing protein